ncbi:MAG: hypothetical protein JNK25_03495 [Phycisphaerae bacterium]|nr:hypothetical protein [Phycisphaerae bacterium]
MILPTKHIPPHLSLVGIGASLLALLDRPQTISTLWDRARAVKDAPNFESFVLAIDLLYLLQAVELEGGLLRRAKK